MVMGPLPGVELMARSIVIRFLGVPTTSYVMVATTSQLAIPPPVRVGAGAAAFELCVGTATVTRVFGAGAIEAVVKIFTLFTSFPDVSSVWVIAPRVGFVTVNVAVCWIATPLAVADTVLVSATVELSVPEATPIELVVPLGCVNVLPLPLALSTTVTPLTGLPKASLAVTRIVDVSDPGAMLVGAAEADHV